MQLFQRSNLEPKRQKLIVRSDLNKSKPLLCLESKTFDINDNSLALGLTFGIIAFIVLMIALVFVVLKVFLKKKTFTPATETIEMASNEVTQVSNEAAKEARPNFVDGRNEVMEEGDYSFAESLLNEQVGETVEDERENNSPKIELKFDTSALYAVVQKKPKK